MYEVKYNYYRYQNEKKFDTYEAAKKFFYVIRKNPAVKYVELNCL